MPNAYTPDNLVRLTGAFTVAGVATDPTTVTCEVKDPTGVITTYASPVKDSVGNYHQDVTVTTPGIWYYEWDGAGTVVAQAETFFVVSPTQV